MKKAIYLWIVMGEVSVGSAQTQGIFLQDGTQGANIGAAISFDSMLGAHIDFDVISLSYNFSFGDNRYQDDVRPRQGRTYTDTLPLCGSDFRTTAGVRFSDDGLSGTSVPISDIYTLANRKLLVLPGMYAVAEARYPTVMPCFDIDYGYQLTSKGFDFIADIDVAYGILKSSYTLLPQLTARIDPMNSHPIATNGLQESQREMSCYRWYPVIQVGMSYRFQVRSLLHRRAKTAR